MQLTEKTDKAADKGGFLAAGRLQATADGLAQALWYVDTMLLAGDPALSQRKLNETRDEEIT